MKRNMNDLKPQAPISGQITRRAFVGGAAVSALALALAGCGGSGNGGGGSASGELDYSNWDAVLEAAKGQTVNYYAWGGAESRNTWLEEEVATRLKDKYDITLNYTRLESILDALTQLSSEMEAGTAEDGGSIDFLWINGENFFSAKENGYLWGPFAENLPNYNSYVDTTDSEIAYDFGSPVEGYEAPYGKAQMQMWYDSSIVPDEDIPSTVDEFKDFVKKYKGKVTYPEPGDFTGTAFISLLIAGVIGTDEYAKLSMMDSQQATEEAVLEIVKPGFDYLNEIKPYLWKEGKTYPADSSTQGTMFADGELVMNMGYGAPKAEVDNGTLPDTVKSFLLDSGTCGNANFHAIAYNAPHKAAAMVAINEFMDPEVQLSQYEVLGTQTVLDLSKIPASTAEAFDELPLADCQIALSELLAHRIPDPAGPVVPVLEKLWLSEVAGK